MSSVTDESGRTVEHVHEPCIECGEAEAMVDGLCEECTTTNPVVTAAEAPE